MGWQMIFDLNRLPGNLKNCFVTLMNEVVMEEVVAEEVAAVDLTADTADDIEIDYEVEIASWDWYLVLEVMGHEKVVG